MNNNATDYTNYICYFPGDISKEEVSISLIEETIKQFGKRLTKHQQAIAWRRHKIFQMMVTGITNTYQLAAAMHISQSTCFRDQQWLKDQATKDLQTHVATRLPWQYKICSEGIAEIIRYAWSLILQDDNNKTNKIATLALIANCYKDLLEISTNASIITDALHNVQKMKDEILGTDTTKTQPAQVGDYIQRPSKHYI